MANRPIIVILGGGAGKGLYPLTKGRSKAAVPFGGKYRLVDITLSNCLLSEYYKIFVLTQYNSGSLNRHIVQSFQIPPFLDGFVDVRAASLTAENPHWYQGTADAVRQTMRVIQGAAEIGDAKQVIILSGDHLYRMDYRKLLAAHIAKGADVTVGVHPVSWERTPFLGVAQWDEEGRVTRFLEKSSDQEALKTVQIPADDPDYPGQFWGSMGIYVFEIDKLDDFLSRHPDFNEFGRDVLPSMIDGARVMAYPFEGYWENVGTIRSFYNAMMELTEPEPKFDFEQTVGAQNYRLFARGRSLPPAKINGALVEDSMIAEGAIIDEGSELKRSLIGMRSFLDKRVVVEDSILFGCDDYEPIEERQRRLAAGEIPLGIGEGSILRRCIIDKDARIGRDVILDNPTNIQNADTEKYSIRDGIIVVPKHVVIEDHFRMEGYREES